MPVSNEDVAEQFFQLADLLEIEGANQFRVRAYRDAGRAVEDLPDSIAAKIERGDDLSELPNIGEDLAGKIREIVEEGRLGLLDEVEERTAPTLSALLDIPGLGATRVRRLHEALGVESLEDLREAAEERKVREVEGFSEKSEQNILEHLERETSKSARVRLKTAENRVRPLVEALSGRDEVKELVVAGSIRRRKETCGDADLVATVKRGGRDALVEAFCNWEDVREVVSRGKNRATIRLSSGFQVDLRVVPQVGFGAALHYFTGALQHHLKFRQMAQDRGETFNEYGIFKDDDRVAGRTEKEVFEHFGLPYIVPELREDRGEIDAARDGALPDLVTLDDIRGDLHLHTKASDGAHSLEEMVKRARSRGYDYVAVTDHCQGHAGPPGLDPDGLAEQRDEIEALREKYDDIAILRGAEVDILKDGRLDLPDKVLRELELVVFSIHAHMELSGEEQTERVLKAMDNPHGHILGHPTGRILGKREGYEIDLGPIIEKAAERNVIIEVSAQPNRLDLNDVSCRRARERGVILSIDTDAHMVQHLEFMRHGVDQARRGWLEAGDVANTRKLDDLRKLLDKRS